MSLYHELINIAPRNRKSKRWQSLRDRPGHELPGNNVRCARRQPSNCDGISAADREKKQMNASDRIDATIEFKAALAHREIRVMADSARKYVEASVERYNRSAGQSRRQWNMRNARRP